MGDSQAGKWAGRFCRKRDILRCAVLTSISAPLTATVAMAPVPASAGAGPFCPDVGTQEIRWRGNAALRSGKGYVTTPMGQVHYRRAGPAAGPVIVLLHQTPWSMVQYSEVQACLAELGIASIAVDTPGYGLSDAPVGEASVEDYANNLRAVLDALNIDRAFLAGHHTGAAIAVAFAARFPQHSSGLILHGVPLYNDAEREARLTAPERDRTLSENGSHLADYYRYIRNYAGTHTRTMITGTWSTIHWYLSGGSDNAHHAVYRYDLQSDLRQLTAPVLILSDAQDSLHPNDLRAAALNPAFRYRLFSNGTAHAMMLDPASWAEIAAEFVH